MQQASLRRRIAAGAVHFYTASGAVLALLIVLAAIQGDVTLALWIALVALVIDSTDGMLARWVRVSQALPWFDGRKLDDIVDYLTYVFAPVVLLWSGGFLPSTPTGVVLAALPLLASGYQFCRIDAKTDDHFFLGFPSYWNIVAFFVIVFDLSPPVVGGLLLVCSALVFVPIRYVYPSRTVAFRPLTLAVTALWLVTYAIILLQMPNPHAVFTSIALLYLVYYLGLSVYLTVKTVRKPSVEEYDADLRVSDATK